MIRKPCSWSRLWTVKGSLALTSLPFTFRMRDAARDRGLGAPPPTPDGLDLYYSSRDKCTSKIQNIWASYLPHPNKRASQKTYRSTRLEDPYVSVHKHLSDGRPLPVDRNSKPHSTAWSLGGRTTRVPRSRPLLPCLNDSTIYFRSTRI